MQSILVAAGVMTGIGLFFGTVLAVAHRFLKVEEDPRLDPLEGLLPGTNCGACGAPGCRAFAERLLSEDAAPSGCTVSSPAGLEQVAEFLGVDVGSQEKRVARLRCAGGLGPARRIAEYEGFGNCTAAHIVAGGGKGCSWGCLGLADCERACDFDAISMSDELLPVVDIDKCTACNDCVEVCPRDLFELVPLAQRLYVQCNIPLAGEDAIALCAVACDACSRCASDAPAGLVRMENNLPVIDRDLLEMQTPDATRRCPTGAIQWLHGEQFTSASQSGPSWSRRD